MSGTDAQPRVEFAGTMQTEEGSVALKVLESWLGGSDALRHKVRLFGEEIVVEDAGLYVYAYTGAPAAGPNWFLLEGHTTAQLGAAIAKFEGLLARCIEAGVTASFDLCEIDEDGNPVGNEHRVG